MTEVFDIIDDEVLPDYIPSTILDGAAREEAMRMMRRLAEHVRNRTTDQMDAPFEEPIDNYLDEDLFRAEVDLIFKRIPLPLALSCELPGPNTYKAVEVVGVPVILTRDAQGLVHAMLNVCRHRGALLCEPGHGRARALTCPYHAWSFGMDGTLKGLYGESTFGDFDKSKRNLFDLPVVERAGIVFVCLTRGLEIDIDSWLGDFAPLLESLKLDECELFSSRMMPGPNWKVVIEGYLEGYHFAATHPQTVFKVNHGNTAIFDGYGPHERIGFALRSIDAAMQEPEDEWDPASHVGSIFWLFPGFSIAGGWRDRMTIGFPLPTTSVGASVTEQRILIRKPIQDSKVQHDLEVMRDWFYDVVYNEDYLMGYGVQKGVSVTGGETQIFGRNEAGVQYVHRTINRLMAENHEEGYALPRVAG